MLARLSRAARALARVTALLAVAIALPPAAFAEAIDLSLETALSLARERSGRLLLADSETAALRLEALEAALPAADASLELSAGPRFGERDELDAELAWRRPFEPRGAREARERSARARGEAAAAEARRLRLDVLARAARLHASALHARALLEIAEDDLAITERLLEGAVARRESGEASRLDESLARAALARSAAVRSRRQAALARAKGELRALLGLDPRRGIRLVGELMPSGSAAPDERPPEVDQPSVAVLRAGEERAAAELEAARAEGRSARAVFASVGREEGATVVHGGLSWTLPARGRGAALAQAAAARREGLALAAELEASRIAARLAAESEAARALARGAADFAASGLPSLREAAALLEEAYRLGALPLIDVLAMRREAVAARRESLDLFLEAAHARHEARRIAGREPES